MEAEIGKTAVPGWSGKKNVVRLISTEKSCMW
jgi:hypothetical protein